MLDLQRRAGGTGGTVVIGHMPGALYNGIIPDTAQRVQAAHPRSASSSRRAGERTTGRTAPGTTSISRCRRRSITDPALASAVYSSERYVLLMPRATSAGRGAGDLGAPAGRCRVGGDARAQRPVAAREVHAGLPPPGFRAARGLRRGRHHLGAGPGRERLRLVRGAREPGAVLGREHRGARSSAAGDAHRLPHRLAPSTRSVRRRCAFWMRCWSGPTEIQVDLRSASSTFGAPCRKASTLISINRSILRGAARS